MDFPKKQAQRLMPLYLLEYSEKLFTNHPNPEDPWGGGEGSDYAEIVDVTNGFPDETKTNEILANPSKYILHGTITINDFAYHIFASYAGYVTTIGHTWMQIIRQPSGSNYVLKPYAFGYRGSTWRGPYAYLWKISYDDIYNKPTLSNVATSGSYNDLIDTPTFSTVATSGSYNDLLDKPVIPDTSNLVTTDTEQTITGLKTIGETNGTTSEIDFSGFTFKLSNKAINHPEADIKIRNGSYDGYQHPIISSSKGLYVNLAKIRLGDDGNNTYGITMPDSSTWESDKVLATTSDIPSLDGYATQTWVQEQGYAISSEIPTVNNPTITFTQGGTTKGTITLNQSGDQTIALDAGVIGNPSFLNVDDPNRQMYFSLDGSEFSYSRYVDLSSSNRMFYVNLSALNPVFKDGLTSTYNEQTNQLEVSLNAVIPDTTNLVTTNTNQTISGFKEFDSGKLSIRRSAPIPMSLAFRPNMFVYSSGDQRKNFLLPTGKPSGTADTPTEYTLATTDDIPSLDGYALKTEVPSTATSTSTSTVTPTTGTFVTGTSTNTANVVNSVTYTPSSETLTFTYADNTTASFTFLTSNTTVTSGTTSVVTSVTDSTSNAMTGATVSTSTTTTLS